MKIIDLLNKIANGEKLPKRIKIDGIYYKAPINLYTKIIDFMYISEETNENWLDYANIRLNDEVEIIEEDKKIPEKLDEYDYNSANEIIIRRKINEIIDYLNSKGE